MINWSVHKRQMLWSVNCCSILITFLLSAIYIRLFRNSPEVLAEFDVQDFLKTLGYIILVSNNISFLSSSLFSSTAMKTFAFCLTFGLVTYFVFHATGTEPYEGGEVALGISAAFVGLFEFVMSVSLVYLFNRFR